MCEGLPCRYRSAPLDSDVKSWYLVYMSGLDSIRAINAWAASPEGKAVTARIKKNEGDQRAKRLADYCKAKNGFKTPRN